MGVLAVMPLEWIGEGLVRPECVLCTAEGIVWSGDWRGGVVGSRPGDDERRILATVKSGEPPLLPNGIALMPDGSFLVTDLSEARGGVWRLNVTGELEPFLTQIGTWPLPATNFVCVDSRGRVWITVSTRLTPRSRDYRSNAGTGCVILVDEKGARIVADGLGYANECLLDDAEEYIYVNETFARRLTRFRIREDGSLCDRQSVASFGAGIYPDGLALDAEGGIWVASIISNRLIRIDVDGRQELILDGGEVEHVNRVEEAFLKGTLDRQHLDTMPNTKLRSISSIAFGGKDLRTIHLGSLLGDRIATIRSPVAGLTPVHWNW